MTVCWYYQHSLMDKMYDNQDYDKMNIEDRMKMAESCGLELRKLIHTYTGLDTLRNLFRIAPNGLQLTEAAFIANTVRCGFC